MPPIVLGFLWISCRFFPTFLNILKIYGNFMMVDSEGIHFHQSKRCQESLVRKSDVNLLQELGLDVVFRGVPSNNQTWLEHLPFVDNINDIPLTTYIKTYKNPSFVIMYTTIFDVSPCQEGPAAGGLFQQPNLAGCRPPHSAATTQFGGALGWRKSSCLARISAGHFCGARSIRRGFRRMNECLFSLVFWSL